MDEQTAPQIEPGTEPVEQPSDTAPTGGEKSLPQSQVNALIAKARREGYESAAKRLQPPTQTPAAMPAPVAPTNGDPLAALAAMQTRLDEMEMRTRYVPLAVRAGWDDAQTEDMFDLYRTQRPQDTASWIQEKTQKFGLGRASPNPHPTSTQSQTQLTTIPAVPSQPPISDKGSPAPGGVLDWEREYAENPIGMSSAARQRMDAKYGPEKARRMRVEAAQRQAEGIKVERPKG